MIKEMTQRMTKAATAIAIADFNEFFCHTIEALKLFHSSSAAELKPLERALCFQGLLELGRGLGRLDSLDSVNLFFMSLADGLPDGLPKNSEAHQQIAFARLDVFEEAVARGATNFRMMAFMVGPSRIDVAALPSAQRRRAIVSLFELTERLIDMKDNIDTDGCTKHEPLAMVAGVLEAYALQEGCFLQKDLFDTTIKPVYLYANAVRFC